VARPFETLGDRFAHVYSLPLRLKVECSIARQPREARAQIRIDRAEHVDAQVHQVLVGGVRHVELEDGELGVVLGADALVAERAPDLVHAVEAADEQPLEIELRRDAQDEL